MYWGIPYIFSTLNHEQHDKSHKLLRSTVHTKVYSTSSICRTTNNTWKHKNYWYSTFWVMQYVLNTSNHEQYVESHKLLRFTVHAEVCSTSSIRWTTNNTWKHKNYWYSIFWGVQYILNTLSHEQYVESHKLLIQYILRYIVHTQYVKPHTVRWITLTTEVYRTYSMH